VSPRRQTKSSGSGAGQTLGKHPTQLTMQHHQIQGKQLLYLESQSMSEAEDPSYIRHRSEEIGSFSPKKQKVSDLNELTAEYQTQVSNERYQQLLSKIL
jgi:hypothetical protein